MSAPHALLALVLLSPLSSDPVGSSDPAAHSSNWTRFRGPLGNGVVTERQFPAEWGPETNIAWSVELESGWSSPIVLGDRIFVSAAVDPNGPPMGMAGGASDPSTRGQAKKPDAQAHFLLSCLSLENGEELWTREVGKLVPAYPVHRSNTYATESPTTDGERIFVTFGGLGELVCFDLEGEELWRVETGVFKTGNDFGWGISLVTHDGLVFLQTENEEESYLAAFDAESGEQAWRVERDPGTSWGSPLLWGAGERKALVAMGRDAVTGYDPAEGKELWRVDGIGGSFASSATFDDEHLFFGFSDPMQRGSFMAVTADAEGTYDVTEDGSPVAWLDDRGGPGFASPVANDGLVYVIRSPAQLACYDTVSGEQLWRERLPDLGTIVASPWIAGDELYIMDEGGMTVVLRAGPEFEILRTNTLEGLYWGTPSIAGDALLLRESSRLYCIREN